MGEELMFKAFFKLAPDAIFVIKESGIIIHTSHKAEELFGYAENELVGISIENLMPVNYAQRHKGHRENFMQRPVAREMGKGFDLTAKRKDGSLFYAEISLNPTEIEGESLVLATIRDITEKKELFDQLEISNEQFKGAFEYSAIGMALVSTQGDWLKVNKSVCDIVGYSEEELLSKTFQDITHPDDLDLDLEHLGEMLRGEIETYQMEKRYFHKKGHIVWVLLSVSLAKTTDGKPLHFVSQIKDITERKEAEKILIENEQRWLSALDGAGEGVWDWSAKTDKVFFSKQWKKMLGYEENEIGDTLSEWDKRIHPDDKEKCYEDLNKHLKGEAEVYANEHRLLCKDGLYKWILDRGKVIERDDEGKPLRVIGTHSDISYLKAKEKELQESIDIISRQNARLMNFTYIVSHNLRSHTSNFQILLEFLEKTEDADEKQHILKLLQDNSSTLSETIMHLNEVVQIQTNTNIKKEWVSLRKYADKTKDILGGEISLHSVSVENNIANDILVNYNPAYLESILLNFISNAIKYRHQERIPQIKLYTGFKSEKMFLAIADNGLGMNLEKTGSKLFGLYKTFHRNTNARGVGLFITKNQVEAMGGNIEVESEENVGTTFKVFFHNEPEQ